MERSERPQAQCRRSASTRLKSEHRDTARTDQRERDVEREREKKQEAGLPPSRMQVKFDFFIVELRSRSRSGEGQVKVR